MFDSSKVAEGEVAAMPATVAAATVGRLDVKNKLDMPLQGGQPCDKKSTNLEGRSTPPSELAILLIITVAQSWSAIVPNLQ